VLEEDPSRAQVQGSSKSAWEKLVIPRFSGLWLPQYPSADKSHKLLLVLNRNSENYRFLFDLFGIALPLQCPHVCRDAILS
jgi:hypothetical protein